MKKTALVILAAGIGSRYGAGIKQLAKVGPCGELIIDYSIYDALRAGFNKVVFIIRHDIEAEFREVIGDRISALTEVEYVFQELDDLPAGMKAPEGRKKPWGTGHAILAAAKAADCPFAVINADDYYGPEGFRLVHEFLVGTEPSEECLKLCMAGFILGNTLSSNGTVTRGICTVNEEQMLTGVVETFDISSKDGVVTGYPEKKEAAVLSESDIASMNLWGLDPKIMDELRERFTAFLEAGAIEDPKAEFLLPTVINEMIRDGKATVKVLPTHDRWYGVTYQEDREYVAAAMGKLTEQGVYKEHLFD